METITAEGMTVAENNQGHGISKFIRDELNKIPEGEAVKLSEFATTVMSHCPTVRDRSQAYARISTVLKKAEGFCRLEKEKVRYIGRSPKANESESTSS